VNEQTDPESGSITQTMKFLYEFQPDYETVEFMGRYCKPVAVGFSTGLSSSMSSDGVTKWLMRASELKNAWRVLVAVVLIGTITGLFYVKLLQTFATYVMYACFLIAGFVPLAVGSQMIRASRTPGVDSPVGVGNESFELVLGSIFVVFGSIILVWLCCAREVIGQACACVEVACECMLSAPSLFVMPLFDMLVKLVALSVMLYFFLMLITCGEVLKKDITATYPTGMDRTFTYTTEEKYFLLIYVFAILWVYELIQALTLFSNAFAVRTWYFVQYDDPTSANPQKPSVPCCPTLHGYYYGIRYHLGSIVFGSILIPPVRILNMFLYVLEKSMTYENWVSKMLMWLLQGFVYCLLKCIEFLTTNAFIIIAIDSLRFCDAAWKGLKVTWKELPLFAAVYCSNLVFSFIGVLGITCVGIGLSWAMVTYIPEFKDPRSENFIVDPFVFFAMAGLINAGVAMCSVSQVGNITGSIAMCFAYDQHFRVKDADDMGGLAYAPKSLLALYQTQAALAKPADDANADSADIDEQINSASDKNQARNDSGGLEDETV
jgi:hypothetical protein